MSAVILGLFAYLWLFVVMGTCTYLVFWQGHSGWWYLLAIVLCSGDAGSDRKEKDE